MNISQIEEDNKKYSDDDDSDLVDVLEFLSNDITHVKCPMIKNDGTSKKPKQEEKEGKNNSEEKSLNESKPNVSNEDSSVNKICSSISDALSVSKTHIEEYKIMNLFKDCEDVVRRLYIEGAVEELACHSDLKLIKMIFDCIDTIIKNQDLSKKFTDEFISKLNILDTFLFTTMKLDKTIYKTLLPFITLADTIRENKIVNKFNTERFEYDYKKLKHYLSEANKIESLLKIEYGEVFTSNSQNLNILGCDIVFEIKYTNKEPNNLIKLILPIYLGKSSITYSDLSPFSREKLQEIINSQYNRFINASPQIQNIRTTNENNLNNKFHSEKSFVGGLLDNYIYIANDLEKKLVGLKKDKLKYQITKVEFKIYSTRSPCFDCSTLLSYPLTELINQIISKLDNHSGNMDFEVTSNFSYSIDTNQVKLEELDIISTLQIDDKSTSWVSLSFLEQRYTNMEKEKSFPRTFFFSQMSIGENEEDNDKLLKNKFIEDINKKYEDVCDTFNKDCNNTGESKLTNQRYFSFDEQSFKLILNKIYQLGFTVVEKLNLDQETQYEKNVLFIMKVENKFTSFAFYFNTNNSNDKILKSKSIEMVTDSNSMSKEEFYFILCDPYNYYEGAKNKIKINYEYPELNYQTILYIIQSYVVDQEKAITINEKISEFLLIYYRDYFNLCSFAKIKELIDKEDYTTLGNFFTQHTYEEKSTILENKENLNIGGELLKNVSASESDTTN